MESNTVQPLSNSINIVQQTVPLHQINNYIHNIGQAYSENYLGEMNVQCCHCGAKHFEDEKVGKENSFDDCCNHGKVKLENVDNFPEDLKLLFNSEHELSHDFFKNIRLYNNIFSFASFNANIVNFNNRRPGPYSFKIQGQIYYQINTALNPETNQTPSYGQLFIVDADEAIQHRMSFTDGMNLEILTKIENIMHNHNIFAQSYEIMVEELKKQDSSTQDLQLLFSLKPGVDKRRYNFQKSNEVAAIFSTMADGEIPEAYVVICNKSTKKLQTVSTMDPNVEPWIYPLYHPTGSQGWHRDLMRTDGQKRVSRAKYIKYKFALRDGEFNPFILGRRLFQQYLVDSYVKVERDRIEYCKSHQTQLRVASYNGLKNYLNNRTNTNENLRVGKTVILPSTFIGSPRYMLECYHDSMTVTRKKGKADLFITMTCNPNWKEIQENLLPGQQASDRPDLCARVFHFKKMH